MINTNQAVQYFQRMPNFDIICSVVLNKQAVFEDKFGQMLAAYEYSLFLAVILHRHSGAERPVIKNTN